MPLLIDIGEPKWYHWTIFYTKSVLWNLTSFRMWMTPSVKIINSVAHLNFATFLMILYFTLPSSPPSISAFTVSLKIAAVKYYRTHSVDDGSKKCSSSIDYNHGRPGKLTSREVSSIPHCIQKVIVSVVISNHVLCLPHSQVASCQAPQSSSGKERVIWKGVLFLSHAIRCGKFFIETNIYIKVKIKYFLMRSQTWTKYPKELR